MKLQNVIEPIVHFLQTTTDPTSMTNAKKGRAVASGGLGGLELPLLVFVRTINPISTRGTDYDHHSTISTPGFSDLATALKVKWMCNFRGRYPLISFQDNAG